MVDWEGGTGLRGFVPAARARAERKDHIMMTMQMLTGQVFKRQNHQNDDDADTDDDDDDDDDDGAAVVH